MRCLGGEGLLLRPSPTHPYQPNLYSEARIGTPIAPSSSIVFDFTIPQVSFSSTNEPKAGFYGNLAVGRYFRPN